MASLEKPRYRYDWEQKEWVRAYSTQELASGAFLPSAKQFADRIHKAMGLTNER